MTYQDKTARPESSTLPDFAKRHGLSLSTVYRLIRDGDLLVTKIRGLSRILDTDEADWLKKIRVAPKPRVYSDKSGKGDAK
jgi:hypothetical protein